MLSWDNRSCFMPSQEQNKNKQINKKKQTKTEKLELNYAVITSKQRHTKQEQ